MLSYRILELPESEFVRIINIATERPDVISLGPGEPDFVTPAHIRAAVKRALDRGFTHYSAMEGRSELREALAKKLKKENKIDVGPDQIFVTCGSKEALFISMAALLNPGEGAIIPDPSYLAYIPIVDSLNGFPISVQLREENGFEYDVDEVARLSVPKKTKVLILNSPANPTGVVFSKKLLEEIADVAVQNDLIIISDEAYEKLVYDGARHISIGSLNGMEDRVITIQTFSKSYAMCGFRVGYAAGPKKLIDAMIKMHLCTTICAPTISQLAALAALKGPQSCVERMRREYARRRKFVLKRAEEIGLHCVKPYGAFYIFPSIRQYGLSSLQFVNALLKKEKVLVVPGTEFGKFGEGYVRISYATSMENLRVAFDRIERFLKRLKARPKRKTKM